MSETDLHTRDLSAYVMDGRGGASRLEIEALDDFSTVGLIDGTARHQCWGYAGRRQPLGLRCGHAGADPNRGLGGLAV